MTTSGCDVSSRCFSSSTVLLIPFALSCRIFISLCLVFLFCLLCVWECAGAGTCGGLCGGEMRGEQGRTGCIWSRV